MSLLTTMRSRMSAEPGFVAAAFDALAKEGFPTKKTEAWRFTPVRELIGEDLALKGASLRATLPEGVSAVASESIAAFGTLAPTRHFAALNATMHDAPVVLRANKTGDAPLQLRYEGQPGAAHPRVFLELAPNVELTLIESFSGRSGLTNAVLEVQLGAGARLRHVRVHQDAGRLIGHVAVRQGRDSHYESHVVTLGGELMRLDLHVALAEPGAECDLRGAYHVDGNDHVDHHLRVDHHAPHGTSRQDYRGLLDGRGTAVFDGQAIVHREAPGAEAHQSNRNLLLSERANVFTKPHLEIENDDVVASHGATVGAMDEDQVFYLRSRGVDESVARSMLTYAFVRAIVDTIPAAELRQSLAAEMRARLPKGTSLSDEDWLGVDVSSSDASS